ncbi:MAG: hypothetical protein ACFFEY_10650 [Candidatus Thorarchaeota archaeon]
MRFISGLKNLSRKTLILIIVILFIVFWFLFTFGYDIFSNLEFSRYFIFFLGLLAGFTFILFIVSFFVAIEKMGTIIIIIAVILTVPVMLLFTRIIFLFAVFCYIANIFITAFFAYKFCMDSSIKVDDYLYEKKNSRVFTRIVEFVIFFLLSWWFISLTIRFFASFANPNLQSLTRIFLLLFFIDLTLIVITILRLIFTKKLSAYISLFNVLTIFYVLYIIIDLWANFIFPDTSGYDLLSFFIDLLIFIYIIGSIYDRVDYIKEKLKIFRVDTIALFLILMKLVVQIIEILLEFTTLDIVPNLVLQAQILWFLFAIFTLIIGIYTVIKHKEGKSS